MAMKLNNLDTKKITRITSAIVIVVSLAIMGASGWFLMSALGDAGTGPAGSTDVGHIETLDLKSLDQVLQDLASKRSGGDALPEGLRNPFIMKKQPAPAPQPEPEAPPETTPAPQPEPVPAPST